MEWWIPNTGGGTVSYVSGMTFYAVSQWISPLFILLILPFVGEWVRFFFFSFLSP